MAASRAGVLFAVICLTAAPARAGDVTIVAGLQVRGPACPIAPLSVSVFVDSLRVELAGHARQPGTTLVTLTIEPCDAATARVRVAVTSDVRATTEGRDVALEDIALDARPRALALAVAELVRGAETAAAPASVASVAPPQVNQAPSPPFTAGVAVDALIELFPARDTALWGGRASVSLDRRRWSLTVFGEAAAGHHDYDVGEVSLRTLGGGLAVGPRFSARRFVLAPALVGAVASVHIEGHAGLPGVAAGGGSGVTAAVRARLAVSTILLRAVSVRVFVEGGAMLRGFDATVDGAPAAGAWGATFVAGMGLAF